MFLHSICPVCKGKNIQKSFDCPDHSVSKEVFQIFICSDCSFKFTNPIPEEDTIGPYYQSEEYISHTDSNKGLINRLYHLVRTITLNQKLALINTYATNEKTLLDIGCGTGYFLKKAKEHSWKIAGMEPDTSARNLAEKNTNEKIATSISQVSNQRFEVITLWHVLEHIHQLDNTLTEIKKRQEQGNTLIIALPNHLSWDAKHYKSFWAAYDVPRHLYHFNKKSVQHLLLSNGYELIKTKPMWFDSIYVSMLSEKYSKRSTILGIVKGFISNIAGIFSNEYSSHIYIFKKVS
jgi:2-polyprenyl-3-methyl-5-hydroxy-6-metoxy-1,4-benzoquinol methylase